MNDLLANLALVAIVPGIVLILSFAFLFWIGLMPPSKGWSKPVSLIATAPLVPCLTLLGTALSIVVAILVLVVVPIGGMRLAYLWLRRTDLNPPGPSEDELQASDGKKGVAPNKP